MSNSGGGAGYSGIVTWLNSGPGTSMITGAYRSIDTAIMDPPTWFTSVPGTWTTDGKFPLSGFFLSGLCPGLRFVGRGGLAGDRARCRTPRARSRMTTFAMNPAYRADPEREWPMLASAALWADQ